MWIPVLVLYQALHLLLYALVFRNMRAFGREWVVFGYHAGSMLLIALVLATGTLSGAVDLATAVLVLALHGIYSLSFLELWALADGGYSLAILAEINATNGPLDPSRLHQLGASKRDGRARSLQRLGLCRQHDQRIEITRLGRVAAGFLGLVASAADVQEVI